MSLKRLQRPVGFAGELRTDAGDKEPLLPIAEQAGGPIGEAAIHDGVAATVRGQGRDPQRERAVVAQALQALLVDAESCLGEFIAQGCDDGIELGVGRIGPSVDPPVAKELLRAAGAVGAHRVANLLALDSGGGQ